MEHFSAFFSNLFPQKRTRFSANKFGAELKRRRFVPGGDMYTSLIGTKVCPRRGHSRTPGADMGMSQPRTRI